MSTLRINDITPVFVEKYMPDELELGKLYISKQYGTAIHLCACGCGGKTVTPIEPFPSGWRLKEKIVNGNCHVTLRPSIGNWSGERPYHAHYYITDNKIDWLGK